MDEEDKQQLNEVIDIAWDICSEHFRECPYCPLYKHICNGLVGWQIAPRDWKRLK